MQPSEKFYNEVKQIVIDAGMIIEDVKEPIQATIKTVKKPKFYAFYTKV